MSITFTYSALHADDKGEPGFPLGAWRLEIDGAVNDLFKAASIVRTHAINTGDLASIRLVRTLKNAKSPAQISAAIAAFRRWIIDASKPGS